jgi:hypothetical protein
MKNIGASGLPKRVAQAKIHYHKAFCGASDQARPRERYYVETN